VAPLPTTPRAADVDPCDHGIAEAAATFSGLVAADSSGHVTVSSAIGTTGATYWIDGTLPMPRICAKATW
jgi:hypothetical protein